MRRKTEFLTDLRVLAGVQGGVVSRAQLLAQGLSRRVVARMLADGIIERLTPGIYTVGAGQGWLGRAWAGVLLGGDDAVLGYQAAGRLHGFLSDEPPEIEVFTPERHVDRPGWRFVLSSRRGRGEPPRTSVEETVLDMCASLDEDEIAALVADVISRRATTAKRLRAELSTRGRQRHRALIYDIVGDADSGVHSALERRFLVNVERAHGLPVAVRQAQVRRLHRSDAWYEDYRVIAELDSKLHHGGGATFHDMARDNDHALTGVVTLRFGWAQVSGVAACQTALFLGQVLMSRGWEGPIQPCSHCQTSFL